MVLPNCIFHIPFKIDEDWPSASQIRPIRMLNAFKSIGYNVDIVMGYGKERKNNIQKIKDKIRSGVKYDFMYSESSTEPTLLTEKNHIPKFLFLDFGFFNFCRNNGINIGLFYRDVYWKFDEYKLTVSFIKRIIACMFYKYDLFRYKRLLNTLYLPSLKMYDYVPMDFKGKVEELPPAAEKNKICLDYDNTLIEKRKSLNIFYVGGLNYLYNLEYLFDVVSENKNLDLTVCCREKEWIVEKGKYEKYLNDRIKVIHESGDGLIPYFKQADLFSIFVEPQEYREFAMPVKLFDYLTYGKPIIATSGTGVGEFIDKNSVGWSVDYSKEELRKKLMYIIENPEVYIEKVNNIKNIIQDNTWEARAIKVMNDLKK
ncbi:MAG: glycosyltransferase [Clostridium tyrobutyricum]|uniref:glycosyltransferase n=1 Tax=Clostridium tyrobutyricum TaxID=1519 RepID=UPI0024306AE9|nr:glycosyltransferase [Clostridium tyrobutyricum]MCH4199297.1 glycosyltransferase [Clostridium tyrobutyricum]MCH4237384.1 glycosyltransferase [Clostridium tyrobutyricum]MCH4258661.1 glycosyltransferase [Clostridium tyrobutyricum]MCI1239620.1 glycosyltransferase [Clostridium tyrobutyricum]MCI1652714.1 glycosyltransferase [Clostridium tyrobutyricum]